MTTFANPQSRDFKRWTNKGVVLLGGLLVVLVHWKALGMRNGRFVFQVMA